MKFDYRKTKSPYYKYLLKTLGKKAKSNERLTIIYYLFNNEYLIEVWFANTYSKKRPIELDLIHLDGNHNPCIKRLSKIPQDKVIWAINLLKKFSKSLVPDDFNIVGFLKEEFFGKRQITYGEIEHKPVDINKFDKELETYLKNKKFDYSIVDNKVFKGGLN